MKLGELSHGIGRLMNRESENLDINHITHDSRKVQHGSIFVAIRGALSDGHEYIACATQLGATCIATDTPDAVPCCIPTLQVENPRADMARLARRLYKNPDQKLKIVGLTGTNGKTTGTYLIQNLLRPLGNCGRTGTLSYYNGISEEKAARTTPEAPDLYRTLGEMVSNGCTYAAMEISSHGLVLNRVLGLELDYAIFTNLSQDHLDFHETMEAYFEAKQRLFEHLVPGGKAILNWDDPATHKLTIPEHAKVLRFGQCPEADLRFEIQKMSVTGSTFRVTWDGKDQIFTVPLLGAHNIYNLTAAMTVALSEGRSLADIAESTSKMVAVPGRGEMLNLGQEFGVMIDFAHTPDAMKNILKACREITDGRLIVVFGAGGDRDHGKRHEMGAMADAYADIIVLTSDNPRTEDPEAIMEMVAKGINREPGQTFQRNWDRREAIAESIKMAKPGDLVLLAGKGHETSQEVGRTFHPFDDRIVASEFIKERLGRGHE